VIAAVNGMAVGGGFEIVLACDVVLAADHAQFFLPEMQRGFLPDAGAVQRLPRKLPLNVAMEMMLTGRRMDAAEAKHWGLASHVFPRVELMARAREMAESIAAGAPLALRALKAVVPAMLEGTLKEAFDLTRKAVAARGDGSSGLPVYERMLTSEDFLEGARAFAEKRAPRFQGR
jgi:crotonobetainyl-CoA hydratase